MVDSVWFDNVRMSLSNFIVFIASVFTLAAHIPAVISSHERIFQGEYAQRGQFPYQVSLQRRSLLWNLTTDFNETVYRHICSGAIVNDRWVVTAAQCVQSPITVRNLLIVAGAHHLHGDGIRYPLMKIVTHPGYSALALPRDNDIALLRTRRKIQLNDRIRPISLGRSFVTGGVTGIVSGWASTQVISMSHIIW